MEAGQVICLHKPPNEVSSLCVDATDGRKRMGRELRRLVLSVTSHCNLRCKYCYVFNDKIEYPISQTMSPAIIQKAIHRIFNSYNAVQFVQFFGGEPNLALQSMQIAVHETRKVCDILELPHPQFGIVTNLTILNEEILTFYRDNRLKVTVSVDGPETVHDSLRGYPSGRGTHDKVIHNLGQLRDTGIPFAIECTFTRMHIEKGITVADLLKYFDQIGAVRADIVCVMARPNSEFYVYSETFQQLVQLFIEAIDHWFDYWRRGGKTMFGIIGETVAMLGSSQKEIYCPAGESYLAVGPDGRVYPCHLFIGDKRYVLGSVEGSWPLHFSGFKKSFNSISACSNCSISSLCLSCLGRNEYYCGILNQPFAYDCILKRGVISRILDNLRDEMLPINASRLCELSMVKSFSK